LVPSPFHVTGDLHRVHHDVKASYLPSFTSRIPTGQPIEKYRNYGPADELNDRDREKAVDGIHTRILHLPKWVYENE
jgi:hypothetical protein